MRAERTNLWGIAVTLLCGVLAVAGVLTELRWAAPYRILALVVLAVMMGVSLWGFTHGWYERGGLRGWVGLLPILALLSISELIDPAGGKVANGFATLLALIGSGALTMYLNNRWPVDSKPLWWIQMAPMVPVFFVVQADAWLASSKTVAYTVLFSIIAIVLMNWLGWRLNAWHVQRWSNGRTTQVESERTQ